MSYVGPAFEYDVFVSYAHGLQQTDSDRLQQWSRHVANELREGLAFALNGTDSSRNFRIFMDNKDLVSGDALTGTLQNAVKKSAVLLIIMLPLYASQPWCLDELRWFLEAAGRDGRRVKFCQIIRAQRMESEQWPKELCDERGEPVVYIDFATEVFPVGFYDRDDKQLLDLLPRVQLEILRKLRELRRTLEARANFEAASQTQPQPILEPPLIFLRGDHDCGDDWQRRRDQLENTSTAFVSPPTFPSDDLFQQGQDRRLDMIATCNGFAILGGSRASPDLAAQAAFLDARNVRAKHKVTVPCAIVEETLSTPALMAEKLKIPRISTETPDWPARLLKALGLNSRPTATG